MASGIGMKVQIARTVGNDGNRRNHRLRPKTTESKKDLVIKVEPLPLEFITLTERPATQKADFSYAIRSRAMHSFIQSKNTPKSEKEQSKSLGVVKKESKSAGELSGKFKLSTWSRKPRQKIAKSS